MPPLSATPQPWNCFSKSVHYTCTRLSSGFEPCWEGPLSPVFPRPAKSPGLFLMLSLFLITTRPPSKPPSTTSSSFPLLCNLSLCSADLCWLGLVLQGDCYLSLGTLHPNPHSGTQSPPTASWSGSLSSLALLPSTLAWTSGLQPHCLSVSLADTMLSLSSGLCRGCSHCLVCWPHSLWLISTSLTAAPAP